MSGDRTIWIRNRVQPALKLNTPLKRCRRWGTYGTLFEPPGHDPSWMDCAGCGFYWCRAETFTTLEARVKASPTKQEKCYRVSISLLSCASNTYICSLASSWPGEKMKILLKQMLIYYIFKLVVNHPIINESNTFDYSCKNITVSSSLGEQWQYDRVTATKTLQQHSHNVTMWQWEDPSGRRGAQTFNTFRPELLRF